MLRCTKENRGSLAGTHLKSFANPVEAPCRAMVQTLGLRLRRSVNEGRKPGDEGPTMSLTISCGRFLPAIGTPWILTFKDVFTGRRYGERREIAFRLWSKHWLWGLDEYLSLDSELEVGPWLGLTGDARGVAEFYSLKPPEVNKHVRRFEIREDLIAVLRCNGERRSK
jgi:hypothetical protein